MAHRAFHIDVLLLIESCVSLSAMMMLFFRFTVNFKGKSIDIAMREDQPFLMNKAK